MAFGDEVGHRECMFVLRHSESEVAELAELIDTRSRAVFGTSFRPRPELFLVTTVIWDGYILFMN